MFPEKIIYPIFLPHAGCPFQCVYCNQRASGSAGAGLRSSPLPLTAAIYAGAPTAQPPPNLILEFVECALRAYSHQILSSGSPGELAFFGGTFTALPPSLMTSVLIAASTHVKKGIFTGIRFSTRPDCIGDDVVGLLSKYPIRTVELGVQSFSDSVLKASRRGYRASSVLDAAKRVKQKGWRLGIQLMAGLPGDSRELFIESMRKAIEAGPDFLRIYPTVVLEGTALADSFRKGAYAPLSLDAAVDWVTPAYDLALRAGISVIRMGLHPDPALEEPGVIVAGPYHPAFGCLVKSRWWRERVDRLFQSTTQPTVGDVVLLVAPNQVGDAIGHRKSNLRHWEARWGMRVKVMGEASLAGNEIKLSKGTFP
jgi:histone acetyltransferase (RNA polymerase elongator complex component)